MYSISQKLKDVLYAEIVEGVSMDLRIVVGENVFTYNDIENAEWINDVDFTLCRLPTNQITLSLWNLEDQFDPENPENELTALKEQTPISVELLITFADSTTETVPIMEYVLTGKPQVSGITAEFTAVSYLQNATGIYPYGTTVDDTGFTGTYYDVVSEILNRIVSSFNAVGLSDLNPLTAPKTNPYTDKEVLQLCAQANCCRIIELRDGGISIVSSGFTEYTDYINIGMMYGYPQLKLYPEVSAVEIDYYRYEYHFGESGTTWSTYTKKYINEVSETGGVAPIRNPLILFFEENTAPPDVSQSTSTSLAATATSNPYDYDPVTVIETRYTTAFTLQNWTYDLSITITGLSVEGDIHYYLVNASNSIVLDLGVNNSASPTFDISGIAAGTYKIRVDSICVAQSYDYYWEDEEGGHTEFRQETITNAGTITGLLFDSASSFDYSANAVHVSEWITPLLQMRYYYEVECRGMPHIEPGDIIYVDTEYSTHVKALISKNKISYSGGIRSELGFWLT